MPTFIGGSIANRVAAGGVGFGAQGSIFVESAEEEWLANTTEGLLGFANDWTISIWTKPEPTALSISTQDIFGVANAGLDNLNHFRMVYNVTEFAVLTRGDDENLIKLYRWDDAIAPDVWQNHILTWNGTALVLYYNGLESTVTTMSTDNAGTMSDTDRDIVIGTLVTEDPLGSSNRYTGNIGHIGIWNTALDANDAAAIFAGKHTIDLRNNSGGYDKSANLVHYYRPGYDSQGREDLVAGAFVNNLDDSTTTDANIVEDAPA